MTKRNRMLPCTVVVLLAGVLAGMPSLRCYASTGVTFLDRPQDGTFTVRVMNWNVWLSSVFPPDGVRHKNFERIIRAVKPDVVCLQEIDPRRAIGLSGIMDGLLPLADGLRWQIHYATNGDNVVLSRYPLCRRETEAVVPRPRTFQIADFHMGQVMCLVDLPDSSSAADLYVIATHFKSRSDSESIRARQVQADSIVRWLRRLRDPSAKNALPEGTPTVILGDMNVYESEPVDSVNHLNTLVTGNIMDEATFGLDIKPDWDGTHLLEVKPRHNAREKDWYTWRSDEDRFAPGALDRILYSDSVMKVKNSFVLNTTTMQEDELSRNGLLATDVLKGDKAGEFDHLPMVVDFHVSRAPSGF